MTQQTATAEHVTVTLKVEMVVDVAAYLRLCAGVKPETMRADVALWATDSLTNSPYTGASAISGIDVAPEA